MCFKLIVLLFVAFQLLHASSTDGQKASEEELFNQELEQTDDRDFSKFLEKVDSIKKQNSAQALEACSTDDADVCKSVGCFWLQDEGKCVASMDLLEEDPECTLGEQEQFLQCLLTFSCETHEQKRVAKCFDDLKDFYLNPTVKKAFAVADVENTGFLTLPFEMTLFCEAMGVDCPVVVENLIVLQERVTQDFLYRYLGYLSTQADDFVTEIEKKAHTNIMKVNDEENSAWENYDGPIRKSNIGEQCGRSFDRDYGLITRVCSPGLACDTRWKICCTNPSALQLHTTKDHMEELEWHYKFSDAGMVMVDLNLRPSFEETLQLFMSAGARRELFFASIFDWWESTYCSACKMIYTFGTSAASGYLAYLGCGSLGTAACTAAGVEAPWIFPFCEWAAMKSCQGLISAAGAYVGAHTAEYMCSLEMLGGWCPRVPDKKYMFTSEGCIPSLQCPNKFMQRASSNTENGNNVRLWEGCGNSNSMWVMEDNQIKLKNNRNRCMHKSHDGNFDGNSIHMWDCDGHINSRFSYNVDEGRIYVIEHTSWTLHKKNGCSNGKDIQTWRKSGNEMNQLWTTRTS